MSTRKSATAFLVPKGGHALRLDKAIRAEFPFWGRSAVENLIQNRQVSVNGKPVWLASWKVSPGDRIEIQTQPKENLPAFSRFDKKWLVADEGDLVVVCKPAGLLSQPTRPEPGIDLLSFAQDYFGPDIHLFHRLDRDTSGLCILTRPGPVNAYLDQVFKQRLVTKEYRALLQSRGALEDQGELRSYLAPDPNRRDRMTEVPKGGKFTFTSYQIIMKEHGGWQAILKPHTGRTHQLRVQLAAQGAPILGDRLYGGTKADRLMLHAVRLELPKMEGWPHRSWQCACPF